MSLCPDSTYTGNSSRALAVSPHDKMMGLVAGMALLSSTSQVPENDHVHHSGVACHRRVQATGVAALYLGTHRTHGPDRQEHTSKHSEYAVKP